MFSVNSVLCWLMHQLLFRNPLRGVQPALVEPSSLPSERLDRLNRPMSYGHV